MKRARLVEENMSYDEIAQSNQFSEEELNLDIWREEHQARKQGKILKKAKFLRKQVRDLKRFSV